MPPAPWALKVDHHDVEDGGDCERRAAFQDAPCPDTSAGLVPAGAETLTFDGFWQATAAGGETTVIISGGTVWHEGERFAAVKVPRPLSCVLVTQDEDIAGELTDDGLEIHWSDGDCWCRAGPAAGTLASDACAGTLAPRPAPSRADSTVDWALSPAEAGESPVAPPQLLSCEDACKALLARDAKRLADALNDGVPPDTAVDAAELWRHMRWEPRWHAALPQTPLLIAAILLEWPQGVDLCLRHGASACTTYSGPLRRTDGTAEDDPRGATALRVALAIPGATQCLVCRQLLNAGVDAKTLRVVRRRHRGEMEMDTAMMLDQWDGGPRTSSAVR